VIACYDKQVIFAYEFAMSEKEKKFWIFEEEIRGI